MKLRQAKQEFFREKVPWIYLSESGFLTLQHIFFHGESIPEACGHLTLREAAEILKINRYCDRT
jgi:hypothetical protein